MIEYWSTPAQLCHSFCILSSISWAIVHNIVCRVVVLTFHPRADDRVSEHLNTWTSVWHQYLGSICRYYSIQVSSVDSEPSQLSLQWRPSHETAAVCSTAVPGTGDQFTSHHLVSAGSSGAERAEPVTTHCHNNNRVRVVTVEPNQTCPADMLSFRQLWISLKVTHICQHLPANKVHKDVRN